jgi:hypothetical protein
MIKKYLAVGRMETCTHAGTFEGNAVAVKIFKDHLDDERKKEQKREMEEHLRLDHENVLKLLHVDDSRDKT